jgi:alpha-1,6-mannosyltransferase
VGWLAASTVVFRCDTFILAVPVILTILATTRSTRALGIVLVSGILGTLLAVACTVGVDTFFWQRLVWPEAEVAFFNTVLNKSSEWGTSPWYWYVVKALPKAMLGSLVFLPLGLLLHPVQEFKWLSLDTKNVKLIVPVAVFIALYSVLPHKELRFILPAIPILNYVAASGLQKLLFRGGGPSKQKSRSKSKSKNSVWKACISGLARAAAIVLLVCSAAGVVLFLTVSAANYPGGQAFAQFHTQLATLSSQPHWQGEEVTVHLCNLAATSGVTRFGELDEPTAFNFTVTYSKQEGLTDAELTEKGFDFLITEASSVKGYVPFTSTMSGYQIPGYDSLSLIWVQPHLNLPVHVLWPVVQSSPKLYLLQHINRIPTHNNSSSSSSSSMDEP